MATSTYAGHTVGALKALQAQLQTAVEGAKVELSEINAELARRFQAQLAEQLKMKGADLGTVHLTTPEGIEIDGVVRQKVTWDDKKLMGVASTMSWKQAEVIFKISFSVPERTFKGITDQALLKALTAARTTQTLPMVVTFAAPPDTKTKEGK